MYDIDKDFEQIKKDYETSAAFQEFLHEFADEYIDCFEYGGCNRVENVYISNEHVHIEWVNAESLECGSTYMTGEAQISAEYLWNPNWKQDLQDDRLKENLEAMRVQAEKRRVKAEQDKEDRHNLYLELKAEFEQVA